VRTLVTAFIACVLLAVATGCGGSSASTSQTTQSSATSAAKTATGPTSAERAGQLLDDWSATLTSALLVAKARGQAAQAGDRAAYDRANSKLRPLLQKVKKFASQGRTVMSQYPADESTRAVVADGDAWQEWALRILEPGQITLKEARQIADLGATALAAHERAYRAAGKKPPVAFQRRPDQQ
jgi:hypothetical protein